MSSEQRAADQVHREQAVVVLPYAVADGPANMALDEAMLEAAARGESAYLRFYGWSVPTLSLGYFQRIAEVRADPRWEGQAIVRRPTGGGAIWHHLEITYAIAVPPTFPLVRPSTALYQAVHGAIAEMLVRRGIGAHRRGENASSRGAGGERPLLCFTDRDSEDIVSGTHKLVGSAQRRRAGAVLQHGSVLLARSAVVPELVGICDVAELPDEPAEWEEPLRQCITSTLRFSRVAAGTPDALRQRALELEQATYRNAAWTEAR